MVTVGPFCLFPFFLEATFPVVLRKAQLVTFVPLVLQSLSPDNTFENRRVSSGRGRGTMSEQVVPFSS